MGALFLGMAVMLPFMGYYIAFNLYGLDGPMMALFGGVAFSISATIFWFSSQALAATYLVERQARDKQRLRRIMLQLAENEAGAPLDTPPPVEPVDPDLKEYIGPRTVTRLTPVLPAFLALACMALIVANVLVAGSIAVYAMVSM